MSTIPPNLFVAATLSMVEEVGAALIPKDQLTDLMKTHIENCKYKYEEYGDAGEILITDPNHPDFAE